MCNGGGFDIPASLVITGVVVVGLAGVVTSPIWVPGMILYGSAIGAVEGAKATKRGVTYRRTTHVLRKIRKRMLQRVKAGEWQAYLQLLFERTRQEPSKENLHELGVAMLVANDTLKAEQYLSAALAAPASQIKHETTRQASVQFARGVVNQELRDYEAAIEDFTQARNQLHLAKSKEDPLEPALVSGAALPQLTQAECLNSMAYAKFLTALYKVMQADDFLYVADAPPTLVRSKSGAERSAESRRLLEEAIKHLNDAISVTDGDPRGMFYFNRGKAKYFLALISNMDKEDEASESSKAAAFALTDAEQVLMTEALSDFTFAVGTQNFGTTAEGHAMRAQALAVLGQMPEALEASAMADDIDEKVFLIDLSSPFQLMTPWPLPQPPQDHAAHDFVEKNFHRPHYCDHCLKLITNFRSANCCQRCQFRVHRGCLDKAKKLKTCWNEKKSAGLSFRENATQGKEVQAPDSHVHVLQSVYFHKPTWCDACGGCCFRPYGYKCVECRLRIHGDCAATLPNCVMQGAEGKLREVGGNSAPEIDEGLRAWLRMDLPTPTSIGVNIMIKARTLDGNEISVNVLTTDTVQTLKRILLSAMGSSLPVSRLGLLFGDQPLKIAADLATVAGVGLENGSMVSTIMMNEEDAVDSENVSAYDYLELKTRGVYS